MCPTVYLLFPFYKVIAWFLYFMGQWTPSVVDLIVSMRLFYVKLQCLLLHMGLLE